MMRTDPEYRQRLRKDVRSNVAAGFTAVAALTAPVSLTSVLVRDNRLEAWISTVYWLLMLPLVW